MQVAAVAGAGEHAADAREERCAGREALPESALCGSRSGCHIAEDAGFDGGCLVR